MLRKIGIAIQSFLLLIFRAFWGYQFAVTGFGKFLYYNKIVDAFQSWGIILPKYSVAVVGGLELVLGVFLIFGLYTRLSSLLLFLLMIGAYVTAEKDSVVSLFQNFDYMPILSSTAFPFLLAMIVVFAFGAGKISLDYIRGGFNKTKEMP